MTRDPDTIVHLLAVSQEEPGTCSARGTVRVGAVVENQRLEYTTADGERLHVVVVEAGAGGRLTRFRLSGPAVSSLVIGSYLYGFGGADS